MLFGRGSTGGVVNQVSKQPFLADASEVAATVGTGGYLRADRRLQPQDRRRPSALRINAMSTTADNCGNKIDKYGIAPTFRWGIGTRRRVLGRLLPPEQPQRHQLRHALAARERQFGRHHAPIRAAWSPVDPKNYYGAASDYNAG